MVWKLILCFGWGLICESWNERPKAFIVLHVNFDWSWISSSVSIQTGQQMIPSVCSCLSPEWASNGVPEGKNKSHFYRGLFQVKMCLSFLIVSWSLFSSEFPRTCSPLTCCNCVCAPTMHQAICFRLRPSNVKAISDFISNDLDRLTYPSRGYFHFQSCWARSQDGKRRDMRPSCSESKLVNGLNMLHFLQLHFFRVSK